MAATMAPLLRLLTSSVVGRRTLRRISAPVSAALAVGAIWAPWARKRSSEKREPAPAPASTFTAKPSAVSFLTVSGDTATRGSPSRSAVTAIVTMNASRACSGRVRTRTASQPCVGLGYEVQQEQQDQHDKHDHGDRALDEARVGAQMLRIVHGGMAA